MKVFAIAVLLLSLPAWAQTQDSDTVAASVLAERERFQLYTGCSLIHSETLSFGLSGEVDGLANIDQDIATAVESLFRAARIYGDVSSPVSLFVMLRAESLSRVSQRASSSLRVELSFSKRLSDPTTGLSRSVETWSSVGRVVPDDARGISGRVLVAVNRLLDEFIATYMRVNAESC